MNRREVLQRVASLMGGAVSAPAILAVLNGCAPKHTATWKPATMTQGQGDLVAEVAEIFIPRTDTPGARDLGIPAFIDTMLKDAYTAEDRSRYIAGLDELEAQAQRSHGRSFLDLEPQHRISLVRRLQDEAVAAERSVTPVPGQQLRRSFILMTKELALLGYFTSQIGATKVLQYDPVPGAYRGCVELGEAGNGKTWALETSTRF